MEDTKDYSEDLSQDLPTKKRFEVYKLIEVEVKAHVSDFEGVKKKLSEIGAERIGEEHQEDTYFNAPHKDFAKTDEALRIREIQEGDTKKIVLTYKGAKLDGRSKTREEIEVDVLDSEKMAVILEKIGFKAAAAVKKDRINYAFKDSTVSLDDVQGIGKFVEIEKQAPEGENFKDALDEIFRIYKQIGIEEGFERRSYLELLEIK
jgi:adenylate cyclase class 2